MNTIDRLLTSWDDAARAAGYANTPHTSQVLLQSLNFVSRDGTLCFEQKTKRTFQDRLWRFFTGEPKHESFYLQLESIKRVYASIQKAIEITPLTDEQRANCTRLEDRINALGRYVFSRRTEKTLFFASGPLLADYQLRIFSQTTALLAPDSLKRSLYNSGWKHCWLNASLKFFAACIHFDEMLTTPVEDSELDALRKALFRIVEALRKNWDQHVVNALHKELIQQLRSSAFKGFLDGQQEPDEFIGQLRHHFPSPNSQAIKYVQLYKSYSETAWKPGEKDTTDKLRVTPNNDQLFDIEEAYTEKTNLEDVREYFVGDLPNTSDELLDFIRYDAVTFFPNHFEIMLKRGGFNRFRNHDQVSNAKIKLAPNGTITFVENKRVNRIIAGQKYLTDVQEKTLCVCRVIAAIEHSGTSSKRGHYIAHTRAQDGTITTHNDSKITTKKTEDVWANAYYLMLELVDRIEIPLE